MLAQEVFETDQVTWAVTSWRVPSLKVALAVNWRVASSETVAFEGLTIRDVGTAGVTVRPVSPETPCKLARIDVFPTVRAVALPWLPSAFETAATVLFELAQTA